MTESAILNRINTRMEAERQEAIQETINSQVDISIRRAEKQNFDNDRCYDEYLKEMLHQINNRMD